MAAATWPPANASSRFAAACGALSHYVKAAEAERAQQARAAAVPVPVPARRPLPLMPGADVDASQEDHPAEAAGPAPPLPAQMTIVYGDRVMVLDGVPADKAAGLLRLAAAAAPRGGAVVEEPRTGAAAADLPVARKASLQRFMEKRKGRAAARAEPYRRTTDACTEDHLKLAL